MKVLLFLILAGISTVSKAEPPIGWGEFIAETASEYTPQVFTSRGSSETISRLRTHGRSMSMAEVCESAKKIATNDTYFSCRKKQLELRSVEQRKLLDNRIRRPA